MTLTDVRLGDWRDVLPGTYDPDRTVVITDPPFGLAGKGVAPGAVITDRGFADEIPWAEHVRRLLAELPARRHLIRGSGPAVLRRDYPPARRLCVEVARTRRTRFRPDVVDSVWQGWVVYGELRITRRGKAMPRDSVIIEASRDDGLPPGWGHRGITPYGAALWAVETWANAGWLVLDPFAGTGTIGRAALALGHGYVGSEISPRWHSVAERAVLASQPSLGLVG